MKKLSKLLVVLIALTMSIAGVIGLSSCGDDTPPAECTSHVDANADGKCDRCGKDMPQEEPEIHTCEFKCVICGGCLDLDCEEPECAAKCGDQTGRTLYDFEGEDPHVLLRGGELGALGTAKEEEYGATETYVSNFNANLGASIKYYIAAEEDTTANLIVSVCKRQAATIFTNVVATLVNGEMIDSPSRVPSNNRTTDTWTEFEDVNLGCVKLLKGRNVIEFAIMDAGVGAGYNFNAMRLKSEKLVTWYEGEHICDHVDAACGKCTDYGCDDPACADKCEEGWTQYEFAGIDPKVQLSGGAMKNVGDNYIGGLNTAVGATVTFNIDMEAATWAGIGLNACHRPTPVTFAEAFKLTVNGAAVKSSASMPTGGAEWNDFDYVKVGYAKLKKGKNIIRFEVLSEDANKGYNIRGMAVGTAATVADWFVQQSVVDYKFEAENADSNAWESGALLKNNNDYASGGMCVGHVYDVSLSDPGKYYISFDIYAAERTEATLYLCLGTAGTVKASAFPVTLNGADVSSEKTFEQGGWDDFREYEYAALTLEKGKNTVKVTVGAEAVANIDYIGFACGVELTAAPPEA